MRTLFAIVSFLIPFLVCLIGISANLAGLEFDSSAVWGASIYLTGFSLGFIAPFVTEKI